MDRDEFLMAMAHLQHEEELKQEGLELPAEDPPLNYFFNDDFLTLIYFCKHNVPHRFIPIQKALNLVADENQPGYERASAAVAIGRFLTVSNHMNEPTLGRSSAYTWFELARNYGSIIGAWECANYLLERGSLRISFALDDDPFPRLINDDGNTCNDISPGIADAWHKGVRMLPLQVKEGFPGWGSKAYKCALACIINYLTLIPKKGSYKRLGWTDSSAIEDRKNTLKWLVPAWSQIIENMSKSLELGLAHHRSLVEQQAVVCSWVEALKEESLDVGEQKSDASTSSKRSADNKGADQEQPAGPDQLIVIRGEIPTTSDRDDRMLLNQYEMLQKPLPFRTLPTLEALFIIRDKLKDEFPWADEAVNTVMSELIARRRHGALRLGMAPVLLAGSPGTGKTRFAQRLSELLETPNLVINLAGMHDNKVLKGVTRGWASNRPSRIVELILQSKVVNPLVILDEIDKTSVDSTRGGSAQDALLDLLEPGNAQRYQDVYLMTECNLSHCLYIATCNSFESISEPLKTRLQPVYFPGPKPEHTPRLVNSIVRDFEKFWGLQTGVLEISREQQYQLIGLSAREIKAAVLEMLGSIDEQVDRWVQ